MNRWLLLIPLFLLVGCQSYETRSYDVTVQNPSSEAVTLWLTKDGEPYENGWVSPEDLAIESPKNKDYIVSGVIVPPGKTASTGPRAGHFLRDTSAILRVYDGQLMFSEILAVGRDSPLRIDLPLPEGASSWIITRDVKGMIDIRRANDAPARTPDR